MYVLKLSPIVVALAQHLANNAAPNPSSRRKQHSAVFD